LEVAEALVELLTWSVLRVLGLGQDLCDVAGEAAGAAAAEVGAAAEAAAVCWTFLVAPASKMAKDPRQQNATINNRKAIN